MGRPVLIAALLLANTTPALAQPTGPGNTNDDIVLQGDVPLPPPRPRPQAQVEPGCCATIRR